jgi:uncharacterized membrane protein YraQ (UPF0718 family)
LGSHLPESRLHKQREHRHRWERVTYELWLDLHDVGPAFIFGVLASADISQAVSIKSSIN